MCRICDRPLNYPALPCRIRVYHHLLIDDIRFVLQCEEQPELAGEFGNGAEAWSMIQSTSAATHITGINMAYMNGTS